MKKFSVWFFSLIVLFYSFASAVPVKASAPSSYQVDYSSLYSASEIAGILPTLTSSAAGGFFATLGSLAYSYLRSVNVNIVPSSSSMSPTDAMITLGKKVIDTVIDVTQPNRLLWKGLNSGTQYLVTSLLKDAQSGDLTQSNYTDQVFVWKDQVSKPMSDIFNVFDPVVDFFVPDPEAFQSSDGLVNSSWSLLNSASYSSFINPPSNAFDIYSTIHSSFPSIFFNSYGDHFACVDSVQHYYSNGGYYRSFSFDSVIFPSSWDFSDSSTYYFLSPSNQSLFSFVPKDSFPLIFANSVNNTFFVVYIRSSDGYCSPIFYSSFEHSLLSAASSFSFSSDFRYGFTHYFDSSSVYDFDSFYNYILGYSLNRPLGFSSNVNFALSNINAYVFDFPSSGNYIYIDDFYVHSSTPYVSIDADNSYVDRQLPIDNVDNTEATLNLASVIDNLAGSIDGTLSNIDFLTDAINGLVGTVPQVSVDAWNPDRVSEHVTSTDISSAIDGVASLEGTFTDNVQPVFDNFPLFPFIAPIWNTFQQYPVIGLITACIFLVVLFGFLNKLLF